MRKPIKERARITVSAPNAVRAALQPQTLAAVQIYGLLKPLGMTARNRAMTKVAAMYKADGEPITLPSWCQ